MLAYSNRSRVMSDHDRRRICLGDHIAATVLLDGTVAGTWTITRRRDSALLTVRPFRRVAGPDRAAIADEGARLLDFTAAEAGTRDLRILPPG